MGFVGKFALTIFGVLIVYLGVKINSLYEVPPLPKFEDTWWGPGKAGEEDTTIKPFKINVSDEVLSDLQKRLANHRPFTPPLEGIQQQYGINTQLLNEIVEFWKTSYDWKTQEKFLNQYPQFKVSVQGLKIHYLHVKPSTAAGVKVLPLLLLHGWPGSVREFYEIIPYLTTPQKSRDFVFELIIPSLPGYGFSDAAVRPGLNDQNMAVLFKNFMKRIGFDKFYVQGGDWGAIIVQHMATLFSGNVLGVHSNMCSVSSPLANLKLIIGSFCPSLVVEKEHEDKVYPLSKNLLYTVLLEAGYMHLQATKPDTVGTNVSNLGFYSSEYDLQQKVLNDLQKRLANHRSFVPPLEGIQQQYGINTQLLNEIVEFWKNSYNWRTQEKFLNQYPQFKVSVQGLKIHYLHVKPTATTGVKVFPLLLLHGWPGSVREFYEIIPYLTTPQSNRDFVFELIIPSLPGYGFSDAAVRPGLNDQNMAVLFKNLMKRIGFDKYYIQGGDWGGAIVQHMATLYPGNVLGVHSNMCMSTARLATLKLVIGSFWPSLVVEKEHEHKMYPLSNNLVLNLFLEMGYMHLQATKPDTVGVSLNDSPVGLAAYIIEKFTTWTRKEYKNRLDGGLKEKFTYTKLLDNVMIYWVTNSITTSMRLYAETFGSSFLDSDIGKIPVTVPSACARFTNELTFSPESILRIKYKNLVHISDLEGGHFAAFEAPSTLATDIYTAVEKFQHSNKS